MALLCLSLDHSSRFFAPLHLYPPHLSKLSCSICLAAFNHLMEILQRLERDGNLTGDEDPQWLEYVYYLNIDLHVTLILITKQKNSKAVLSEIPARTYAQSYGRPSLLGSLSFPGRL